MLKVCCERVLHVYGTAVGQRGHFLNPELFLSVSDSLDLAYWDALGFQILGVEHLL